MTKSKNNINQEERIVEAAKSLFISKGYNKTSVNSIIKTLGISKGTFYHYFSSKEDLLNRMVDKMIDEALSQIKTLVARKDLNALEKLVDVFSLTLKYKKMNKKMISPLIEALYKDENLLLLRKVYQHTIKLYTPELEKIIQQGQQEKIFNVYDPKEAAEMILSIQYSYLGNIIPVLLSKDVNTRKLLSKKTKGFEWALARLLGIKKIDKKLINRKDQLSILKSISKNLKK